VSNQSNPQTQSIKYLLLLPDGIGIRNFILTDFINRLIASGPVIVWHALPEELVAPYQTEWGNKASWHQLPVHSEGHLPFLLRRGKNMAQLYWQSEPGTDVILHYMTNRIGSGLRGLRNRLAAGLGKIFSHAHAGIITLDRLHARAVQKQAYFKAYLQFLQQHQPAVVFCSHQRSERAVPAMLAARALNIPTATFIYSWDNLPKGRMAVHSDYFLVWSDHMRAEMLQYYPDINPERIFVVGTPQFEHYFNPNLTQSRTEFLKSLGLNPSRPTICFSGDDLTTSPFDSDYLADLAEAVRNIPESQRPQILFRRSPTDTTGRYNAVLSRYPEIVSSEPRWATLVDNDWSKVIPTPEDAQLLANIVRHCDLVVNVGSTMALDFAIVGKPALYLAYNPASWTPDCNWNIEQVYRYPHFNHISRFEPVYWVRHPSDLGNLIVRALQHPEELEPARQRWVEFLVRTPLDQASARCVEALQCITHEKQ